MAFLLRHGHDRHDGVSIEDVSGDGGSVARTASVRRRARVALVAILMVGAVVCAGVATPCARQSMPALVRDVAQDVAQGVAQTVVEPVTDPAVACSRFYDAVWGGSSRHWSDARVAAELIGLQAATAGNGDEAMHRDLNAIEAAPSGVARQELVVATLERCRRAGHLTDAQIARLRDAAKARLGSAGSTQP